MKTTLRYAGIGLACLGALAASPVASAAVSKVICVPWQGDVTKYHTTIAGGGGMLKGVIKTTSTAAHYYRWVYGDGGQSAVLSLSGNTWYTVEDAHAYAGAVGTPFTAQLVVADNNALAGPTIDSYLVKIEDNTLDPRVNIAIDNGLWYSYKQGVRADGVTGSFLTYDGSPIVYWTSSGYRGSATASAVQAFEINGSKESGDFDQDPYSEYVAKGLKFLIMGYVNNTSTPNLRSVSIGVQHGDNPDANSNGIGIEVYGGQGRPIYEGGQIMDAIIASGTPGKLSGRDFVGNGHTATYADIIQDMTDMYAWGQTDGAVTCSATQTGTEDLSGNGVPLSITLEMLNTQCSSGGTFELFLNGISLGTVANDPANSCTCNPPLQTFAVNNAALLATAWNASAVKIVRVNYTGGGNNSNVRARLDWGGGNVKTVCVRSLAANCFTAYLCDGYNGSGFDSSVNLGSVPVFTTVCAAGGSWQYSWNSGDDNSASQWAAIGMIPAQAPPWNAVVPQWVKNYDNQWLTVSHESLNGGLWGKFGYTSAGGNVDPYVNRSATTPSGMVQLSFVDATTADPRWVRSERWMAENWNTGEQCFSLGAKRNLYAMYAMAKAMRLAKPAPVVNFAFNHFDWYRGSSSVEGVAKALSDNMIANGYYTQTYWEGNPLTTAWAVIMLTPTLFASAPIACYTAHPNPSFSDQPISFDPSCSGHSDPAKTIANLVKYEWDWDNNGTFDQSTTTPTVVSHSFHCASVPCAFPVVLKVTDDAGLTATFSLNINITDPPHPPVSKPGGPYLVSLCNGDTLTLDGSASYDPDQGLHQSGCSTCPNDTVTAWNWDLDGAPFTYTSASGKIFNLGSGFTTVFPSAGSYDIGLKVTDNTLLSYPASGQQNLTDQAFGKVLVYKAGFCELAGTPGCREVVLNWANFGAQAYHIYQSYTGPNSGFAEVANTSGTTATVGANQDQDAWYRVVAEKNGEQYLTLSLKLKPVAAACRCIDDLAARPKAGKVQLTWTQAGDHHYNVYRGTIVGGPYVKIASTTSTYSTYLDSAVVNGTTYYYVVRAANAADQERCQSNEANARPTTR